MGVAPCHRSNPDLRLSRDTPLRTRLIVLLLLLLLSNCSPVYVIRAAYEESKILWRRVPIAEILGNEDLDPALRRKLETVLGVREFAREQLGLRVGGSYTSYSHIDRPVLSHLLTAVPRTDFQPYTWWFLFVGSVPYKGYFDRSEAEHEAQVLEQSGHDTHIRPVGAFSTLGWFDDPLLEHLLRLNRVALADVILHELFHNTLFVSGSVEFNEALANFVGKRGSIQYFTELYGPDSPGARKAERIWSEEREFSRFIMHWVGCLKQLYAKEVPESEKLRQRRTLFAEMRKAWQEKVLDRPEHVHGRFGKRDLNNAVLMQHYLYVNHLELFEKLHGRSGGSLSNTITRIQHATRLEKAPFDALRRLVYGSAQYAAQARSSCPAVHQGL